MESGSIAENKIPIPFIEKNSEILAGLGVVGIVVLMILPLHSMILDLLLSFNATPLD